MSPKEVEYSLSDQFFINLFSLSHVRIGVCPEDDLQTSGRIERVRRYKLIQTKKARRRTKLTKFCSSHEKIKEWPRTMIFMT